MMTQQPIWKLVAQLGDARPIDHGGYFIYEDETGAYPPEAEHLESPDDDNGTWIVHRFILEPCTFINGILSDNKFHPDKSAWFQDSMGSMCNSCGTAVAEFVDMICNGSVEQRALAWRMIVEYHGFDNLDSYPLTLNRAEVEARYSHRVGLHV